MMVILWFFAGLAAGLILAIAVSWFLYPGDFTGGDNDPPMHL